MTGIHPFNEYNYGYVFMFILCDFSYKIILYGEVLTILVWGAILKIESLDIGATRNGKSNRGSNSSALSF